MATRTADRKIQNLDDDDRPSGVPSKHRLGASMGEMMWLLLGALVVLAIFGAFYFQATR